MRKIAGLFAGLSLVGALSATPAFAGFAAFVSAGGTDNSGCSRQAPCSTLAAAIAAVKIGGAVYCLDQGPFAGNTVIDKAVTIDCGGAFIVGNTATAFTINAPGGGVVLRNMTIETLNTSAIQFLKGSGLTVDHVQIFGPFFENGTAVTSDAGPTIGIFFAPQDGVSADLLVTDSLIQGHGPNSGGGIVIQPAGSGSARVSLERVVLKRNVFGLYANGTGSTGVIAVQIRDSIVTDSTLHGVTSFTQQGNAVTAVTMDHSSSVLSGQIGVLAQGVGAFAFLNDTTVMSNGTGLAIFPGATMFSYGNNRLTGNVTDGSAPQPMALK